LSDPLADLSSRLDFAVAVAAEAGELILRHYGDSDLAIEHKRDASPVTAADRESEQLIRDRVSGSWPGDGVLGEEFAETRGSSGYRWILDPVDGTKSFIHHVPLFGTLIGLEHEGVMVAGVCRMPALDEVVYGGVGLGAWWQQGVEEPRAARVSSVETLEEALFCTTTITGWKTTGLQSVFDSLCAAAGLVRGWSDCYGHLLVATGRADVMVDPEMNAWDAAAFLPILEAAGGHFVTLEGRAVIDGGNGLSVNAAIRDEVLEVIAGGE
jgi:histidinol-phosphatase